MPSGEPNETDESPLRAEWSDVPRPSAGASFSETIHPVSAPALLISEYALPEPDGRLFRVDVDTGKPLRAIPRAMFGNNAAVWLGKDYLLTDTMTDRLRTAGVSLLRWPGGSTSNLYHWDNVVPPYGEARNWKEIHDPQWAPSTGEFLQLARRLNAIPVIVVNYGYTRYGHSRTDGTLEQAVELAANWVEYCNAPDDGSNPRGGKDYARQRTLDGYPEPFNVKYWEIGNEVFGAWEVGHTDGATYATHFVAFVEAMKAVDPTIHIGAAATANVRRVENERWMADFLKNREAVNRLDFIDIHNYFTYITNMDRLPRPAEIRDYYQQIRQNRELIEHLFRRHAGRDPVPIFFGEFHLTHPQNRLNVSLASGLVTAIALGEIITEGFASAAFWNVANEWNNDGDFGFVARHHDFVPDYAPHPAYYVYYLWTRNMGDTLIAAYRNDWDVHVYLSTFADGEVGGMLINPTDAPRTARLDFGSRMFDGYLNAWVLDGPEFTGSRIRFNGLGTVHDVAGNPVTDADAAFMDFGRGSVFHLPVPANAVVSFVLY